MIEESGQKGVVFTGHKIFRADSGVKEGSLLWWICRYLEEGVLEAVSPQTQKAKMADLEKFYKFYAGYNRNLDVANWLKRDTEQFKEHLLKGGYKPATVNRALATVKTFGNWLFNRGVFPHGNPVYGVKNVAKAKLKPKGLAEKEIRQLQKAAELIRLTKKGDFRSVRDQLILELLLATGIRVSELCSLRLEHLQGKWLRNFKAKGQNFRDVYLTREVRKILDEYLPLREKKLEEKNNRFQELSLEKKVVLQERFPSRIPESDDDYLIINQHGNGLSRKSVNRILNKMARFANAQFEGELKIFPHRLRHSFAIQKLEKSQKDEALVADLLGHQSLQHIRVYLKRDEEAIEEIMER